MNSNCSYNPKTPYLGQNRRFFLSLVTLKFYGWPWKTTGHLFYVTSSLVPLCIDHFVAIGELKLELQSENVQFRSKLVIFCVTLKFHGWPWKTMGHVLYATSSFVHHYVANCEFKLELRSGKALIGAKFSLTSVTSAFCKDITFVNGKKSWKSWLSVTPFHYVPIIVSSWNFQELLPMTNVRYMQNVKVRGQRSRSQRSKPNLTVSGL